MIRVELEKKYWLKLIDMLEEATDCGPIDEGWQSDELREAIDQLKKQIIEPQ